MFRMIGMPRLIFVGSFTYHTPAKRHIKPYNLMDGPVFAGGQHSVSWRSI